MKQKIYLVVYASDSACDGTECGPETKKRCERAIHFIKENLDKEIVVILGAGNRPGYPSYPPLKFVMQKYLELRIRQEFQYVFLSNVCFGEVEDDAWGTRQETRVVIKSLDRDYPVYVISSWYHVPRVRLLWKQLQKKKRKVTFLTAGATQPGMVMYEILKYLFEFFRSIQLSLSN